MWPLLQKKILIIQQGVISTGMFDNLRMAQGTKCLHAIRNYMRKVKLKYQHVFGINTRS